MAARVRKIRVLKTTKALADISMTDINHRLETISANIAKLIERTENMVAMELERHEYVKANMRELNAQHENNVAQVRAELLTTKADLNQLRTDLRNTHSELVLRVRTAKAFGTGLVFVGGIVGWALPHAVQWLNS